MRHFATPSGVNPAGLKGTDPATAGPGLFSTARAFSPGGNYPDTGGVRDGGRVQVSGEGLAGHVVTLGQQLLGDGSRIRVPERTTDAPPQSPTG